MIKKFLLLCFSLLLEATVALAENVVVLDDSTDVVASLTDATFAYRRKILIPDATRKESAQWFCSLDKTRKLKNFTAIFTDTNGKVLKKFKKSDLPMTELSGSLADDSYTYYLNYAPISYPFVVTYEWTVECHDGVIAYPSFCPMDEYDEAVNHASYTIRCASDFPCRYQTVQCDSLQGKYSVSKLSDGTVKATFDNLPPVRYEAYTRPLYERLPMVLFAPNDFSYLGTQGKLDTWKNFGLWQYRLLEGRCELPEALKQKIHAMTDGLSGQKEKIACLYQYLYDNTRYVSIQLGIGGYQPATASEVAANGFGDCKGLSNYMVALLREVGISAIYAAISTSRADLLDDFPSLNQLDHAIVAVPMEKDTLWLECTNARIPLGYVHEDIAGHEAVLITPEGGKIVRLPQYADTVNSQKSEVKMTVDSLGLVQMDCHIRKCNRQFENVLSLLSMNAKEQQKKVLSSLYFPAAQVDMLQINEEKGEVAIDMVLKASSNRYANVSGKRLFMKVNPLKADFGHVTSQENRTTPFFLDDGYCDEEKISISLPSGYQVESLPSNLKISNQFASFKVTFRKEGDMVYVHYLLVKHRGSYKAGEFEEYVKTMNLIAHACRCKLVLVSQ